jgi:flavin-dependent dehydrogenase
MKMGEQFEGEYLVAADGANSVVAPSLGMPRGSCTRCWSVSWPVSTFPCTSQPRNRHPLPIHIRREPISTARCLLAGDAIGLVDPFTAEGILFAIKSGRLAAEAILAGQTERYAARVERAVQRNHRFGPGPAAVFPAGSHGWGPRTAPGLTCGGAENISFFPRSPRR